MLIIFGNFSLITTNIWTETQELACQIVKSLGESAVLQRLASEDLSVLKKANCSKKRNQVLGFNNKENIPPQDSNGNGNNSLVKSYFQLKMWLSKVFWIC